MKYNKVEQLSKMCINLSYRKSVEKKRDYKKKI